MKSTSTAEAISAQLLALLPQHPAETTVHSVFHTSANLLYQGQLVTLLDDTRPLYPCAVRLGGSIPSVAAGEPALLSRERITFPHSGHTIELHRAAVTSLSLFSPLLPLQLPQHRLQLPLDGVLPRLALPAEKPRAVIGDDELIVLFQKKSRPFRPIIAEKARFVKYLCICVVRCLCTKF